MGAREKSVNDMLKIVIAEDSPTQAERLRYLLEKNGYQVVVARNGKEALELVRADKPDIIISDIVMPEMDGYELCHQVKADENLKDTPVILLTALADPADVIKGLECRADNFVTKPYDERALLSRIESIRLNRGLRETSMVSTTIEIAFDGQKYLISSDRLQILNLLLSTYEAAVGKNRELEQAQAELRGLNEQLEQRVEARTADLVKANKKLEEEITRRQQVEHDLIERVKEIRCLHEVDRVGSIPGLTEDEICREVVELMPPAWQYPEVGCARITLNGQKIETKGYRDTEWKQSADIVLNGQRAGKVEVTYLEARPERDEGPFLEEERQLIDSVAELLSRIIEGKHMEAQLRESEERFRGIVNNISLGIFRIAPGLDGKFLEVNPAMEKITGYSKEELLNIDVANLYINPGDREEILKRAESSPVLAMRDINLRKKDGDEIIVSDTKVPVRDEQGKILYFDGILEDITERRRMQEQLIVTDRLASIGELSAGMAHEINNPLTSVIGFSDLILDREGLSEEAKEDLEVVNREAKRTAEIVKNLLTFARKHEVKRASINVNDVIQNVLSLRNYDQKVNNTEVKCSLAPDLPKIKADAFRLQQVFLNIVLNAEFFMHEAHGKGTLTITTELVEDVIRASFTDDGPGITKVNIRRLFDPFFTTKQVGKGTGLGLSICHGIVVEHGGRIYAKSEMGKGATFIVDLPISS